MNIHLPAISGVYQGTRVFTHRATISDEQLPRIEMEKWRVFTHSTDVSRLETVALRTLGKLEPLRNPLTCQDHYRPPSNAESRPDMDLWSSPRCCSLRLLKLEKSMRLPKFCTCELGNTQILYPVIQAMEHLPFVIFRWMPVLFGLLPPGNNLGRRVPQTVRRCQPEAPPGPKICYHYPGTECAGGQVVAIFLFRGPKFGGFPPFHGNYINHWVKYWYSN